MPLCRSDRIMKKTLSAFCALFVVFALLFALPACKQKTETGGETTAASGDGAGATQETTSASADPAQTEATGETQSGDVAGPQSETTAAGASAVQTTAGAAAPAATTAASAESGTVSSAVPAGKSPELTLSATKDKGLKAGDTFDVKIGVRNAKWLASLTVNLNYDNTVFKVEKTKGARIDSFESLIKDYGTYVRYAGYTMNTIDIAENDLCTFTFSVLRAPASGSAKLDITVQQLDLGLDAEGASTRNVKSEITAPSLTLGFAG